MSLNYASNQEIKNFKIFIIKKFILMLVFIAIQERVLYFIVNRIIFPFMSDFLQQNSVTFVYQKENMAWGAISYLIGILVRYIVEAMPSTFAMPVRVLVNWFPHEKSHTDIITFNEPVSDITYFLVKLAFFMFIVLLLFIALLPYVASILVFSRIVSKKVTEMEKENEKKRNLFLADIAHDLKTPLTTIVGYSQVLRDDVLQDEDKKKSYLTAIYLKATKVDQMIKQYFEYVKLESQGFSIKRQNCNLSELLREIVAELYLDFEDKKINLNVVIPEEPIWVYIDQMQLSRAIVNLLNNSLKHLKQEDTVCIKLVKEDDIRIIVADDGVQIEDRVAATIFEPFSMGDKSRNSKNGSGLGLSIAYKIVNMHGGTIRLNRNTTDEYTKAFIITL